MTQSQTVQINAFLQWCPFPGLTQIKSVLGPGDNGTPVPNNELGYQRSDESISDHQQFPLEYNGPKS